MSTMTPPDLINRELSWLEFNQRVLELAEDETLPLLERAKFLDIFVSNLDEFFMKRVGGLKRQVMAQAASSGSESSSPQEQLKAIRRRLLPMIGRQAKCFDERILPGLAAQGIECVRAADLTPDEARFAHDFFSKSVFPVLTPLYVDPGHPFPFISNLSTSFGVLMRRPGQVGEERFARVKVPSVFPTWIKLPTSPVTLVSGRSAVRFVALHEIIASHLGALFPGMELIDVLSFRVTRNADVERDEEDAEDLLEMIAEELRERRFARAVRLEHGPNPNPRILELLMEELDLEEEDVYGFPLPLECMSFAQIAELPRPALKFPAWVPAAPPSFSDTDVNVFELISAGDVLLHHPYESFTASVVRFIKSAVEDPKVIAIKMTLYRTGDDSPFIPLLIRAAEAGKQVVCVVELKARFDEERNMLVAQELEKAGVHVVYGIVGLKTHCKIALVVRQETHGVRCYAHIGTGNYHARTSRLYTDLGLLTARPELTDDVVHLFHYLTGLSLEWKFNKLLVAPVKLRTGFVQMIEREIASAAAGRPARIVAKMNSLQDKAICEQLYRASQAGVRIDLIVRGVCCLRPGVRGLSDNIRVISVVGRFLEHSRIFYFQNSMPGDGEGEIYVGSADWMERNLDSRVEAVVEIEDPSLRTKCWFILKTLLEDQQQAWDMQGDGSYVRRHPSPGLKTSVEGQLAPGAQGLLMKLAQQEHRVQG